jgi:hypothetical protein
MSFLENSLRSEQITVNFIIKSELFVDFDISDSEECDVWHIWV